MDRVFWVQRKYEVYLSLFGFYYVWFSGGVGTHCPTFLGIYELVYLPHITCLGSCRCMLGILDFWFSMDNPFQSYHRSLKILSHNIRGINSDTKWNSLQNNILESNCDIVYIQETKRNPSMTLIFVSSATVI
jgi:hypothetical protein